MCADPRELMDARHAPDDGIILDMDMSGKVRRIGHDDVVAELAIVGDMAIRHDEIAVADHGHADVRRCRAIDRNVFTDRIELAEDDLCDFALVLQVLGFAADRCKLVDAAAFADVGVFLNHCMGADDAILPDVHERPHIGIGTDLDAFLQEGVG